MGIERRAKCRFGGLRRRLGGVGSGRLVGQIALGRWRCAPCQRFGFADQPGIGGGGIIGKAGFPRRIAGDRGQQRIKLGAAPHGAGCASASSSAACAAQRLQRGGGLGLGRAQIGQRRRWRWRRRR